MGQWEGQTFLGNGKSLNTRVMEDVTENTRAYRKDKCGNKFCLKTEPKSTCGFGVENVEIGCLRKCDQVFLCGDGGAWNQEACGGLSAHLEDRGKV